MSQTATPADVVRDRRELLLAYAHELGELAGLAEVLLNEFKLREERSDGSRRKQDLPGVSCS